jgi:hypothetical protein
MRIRHSFTRGWIRQPLPVYHKLVLVAAGLERKRGSPATALFARQSRRTHGPAVEVTSQQNLLSARAGEHKVTVGKGFGAVAAAGLSAGTATGLATGVSLGGSAATATTLRRRSVGCCDWAGDTGYSFTAGTCAAGADDAVFLRTTFLAIISIPFPFSI